MPFEVKRALDSVSERASMIIGTTEFKEALSDFFTSRFITSQLEKKHLTVLGTASVDFT